MSITCDIFCEVVDNFGDAGVCWRMARILNKEQNWRIRLFCSDLGTLAKIATKIDPLLSEQTVEQITVLPWEAAQTASPSQIVIETFGCRIPESFENRIASTQPTPLWINVEYLSAEDWVKDWHGLPSPHPRLPVTKYYFYPGFTEGTGGVLFEKDYLQKETQLTARRKELLESISADPNAEFTLFLFCYPGPWLEMLANALRKDQRPVQLLAAPGKAREAFENCLLPNDYFLKLVELPYVDQPDFDNWLWVSDSLIVRGEESFVRAQLSAKPFIWNIYPIQTGEHLEKLSAFADCQKAYLGEKSALWKAINIAWNKGDPAFIPLWSQWRNSQSELANSALLWRKHLFSLNSLTNNICNFAKNKLEYSV